MEGTVWGGGGTGQGDILPEMPSHVDTNIEGAILGVQLAGVYGGGAEQGVSYLRCHGLVETNVCVCVGGGLQYGGAGQGNLLPPHIHVVKIWGGGGTGQGDIFAELAYIPEMKISAHHVVLFPKGTSHKSVCHTLHEQQPER